MTVGVLAFNIVQMQPFKFDFLVDESCCGPSVFFVPLFFMKLFSAHCSLLHFILQAAEECR